jgi:hypothetical protein
MLALRRIRGLLSIAVVWGVAVSAIGTAFLIGGVAAVWISHIPFASWQQWVITQAPRVAVSDFELGRVAGSPVQLAKNPARVRPPSRVLAGLVEPGDFRFPPTMKL